MQADGRESERHHMEMMMKIQADNQASMTAMMKEIANKPPQVIHHHDDGGGPICRIF